jgi:hypothetical protein
MKQLTQLQFLDTFVFDEEAYTQYLDIWLDGIKWEFYFWKDKIETIGWVKDVVSNDRFNLEEYLTLEKTKFLDVGSGPFSSCGSKTSKTQLDFYAVDPLSYIYKTLKNKSGISSDITPDFAMVENLVEKYGINEFDIVHMRNALDHAFNPLIGIIQMLSVCKIGGMVILNHFFNVAQNENYNGFHQWNLCVENSEFIAWRPPNIKYNITQILKDYANINIVEDTRTLMFKVLLIKKKDILLKNNIQVPLSTLNKKIFEKLSDLIMEDLYDYKLLKIKDRIKKVPLFGNILKKCVNNFRKRYPHWRES